MVQDRPLFSTPGSANDAPFPDPQFPGSWAPARCLRDYWRGPSEGRPRVSGNMGCHGTRDRSDRLRGLAAAATAVGGRPSRACPRAHARRVESLPGVEAVRGDLLGGGHSRAALEGCHTAYYLVHSMEARRSDGSGRLSEPRPAAPRRPSRVRRPPRGLERIVYLGWDRPRRGRRGRTTSARASRWRDLLFTAVPGSTALRASIVIGAGSSSFRLLVRLVERLRVLPLPRWREQPHAADR